MPSSKPRDPPWLTGAQPPGAPLPIPPGASTPAPTVADEPDGGQGLATRTLQAICRDANAPAAARAQAARTLLELAGALRLGAETSRKTAAEMSVAEIDARLADLDRPDTPAKA